MTIPDFYRASIVIGLAVSGFKLPGCDQSGGAAQAPPPATPQVTVVTMKTERVTITTDLPGRTAPYLVAEVRPQVNGIIQERLFEEGGDVKAGDVLYKIDPALYQAAYSNAVAALERAKASLPPIELKVARYKEAVEAKAVSRQAYDEALAALQQAQADIEYGKAAVESARINLGYTQVAAPISGRIGRSNVTVGALVSAHQPNPLAVVQQLDPIYVDVPESSAKLLRLKRYVASGQIKGGGTEQTKVKLRLEDGTPYPEEGTLKFSEVTVDPSTGSFILRMVFPNPEHLLLPGMYVHAVIEEGVVEQAVLVPQQGVSRDYKGNPVALILDAEGKVQQRSITITADRAIGDRWLVSSGLVPGDRVIVEGLQRVRPGLPAQIAPATSGPANSPTTQPATAAK